MNKPHQVVYILVMMLFTSLACITSNFAQQTVPNSATVVAMTLTAISIQNPQAAPNNQPAQPQPINPPPTSTTQIDTPASAPTPATVPCDRATFVNETIPDSTKVSPGQSFTKSWTLKNNGSCSWVEGYTLIFDYGDSMGALPVSPLTAATIAPNQDVEVATTLTAPNQPGTYQGYFMLKNTSGAKFGLGDNADTAFWVKIVVESAPSATDEAAIKQALLAKVGWPESELEFSISQNTGQIAQGSLKNINEIGGAAWFAGKNSPDQWEIAYIGHGIPYCSEIQDFNFPTNWISHCVDASDNTIER